MAKVLIIEDDPDVRALEHMALQCSGHEVSTAVNGCDGYERLVSEAPCIVLLDLMMPVMDGLAFLKKRRENGVALDVPVVCVTAGGPDLVARARALGATGCVEKPAGVEELCTIVREYCGA